MGILVRDTTRVCESLTTKSYDDHVDESEDENENKEDDGSEVEINMRMTWT